MFKHFTPLGAAILALCASSAFAGESQPCQGGRVVRSVSSDGSMVVLIDNSVWQIAAADRAETKRWRLGKELVVCPDRLISADSAKTVNARPMR